MKTVDLRTGYRCNQQCLFCDQGDRRTSHGDAPLAAVVAAMPEGDAIWLSGGEITLRPDLPKLITAAREKGYRKIGLQTNGRILAAAGAAKSLRALGLTDVAIALHAPTATVHDPLVGDPGFRLTVQGIRNSVAAGLTTRIHTVVTRSLDIPAMADVVIALNVRAHRWILAREEATTDPRRWAPRLARIAEPLQAALRKEWEAGLDAETVGMPLCQLGEARDAAADRRDLPQVIHAFPAGLEEAARTRGFGAPCTTCAMQAACPGVESAYANRWGWDEIGPSPVPPLACIAIVAPCPVGCAGCPVPALVPESGRAMRQRLVRAAIQGARGVAFVGGSPWAHPELPKLVGEAARLELGAIEVWGPIHPILTMDDPGRLRPLTRVRVPFVPVVEAQVAPALARLAEVAPNCVVERYAPTAPSAPLQDGIGTWGDCAG